jgi:hypothetical protein
MVENEKRNGLSRPSIKIDYEKYAAFLEDADLSEADKAAFLDALWSIIVSFVDLGFQVHPVQDVCDTPLATHFADSASNKIPLLPTGDRSPEQAASPISGERRTPS